MNKIMISIKPEWVIQILNEVKTIEIRKSIPKELPCEVYIYCTKGNKTLYKHFGNNFFLMNHTNLKDISFKNASCLNEKVVAKFTLNKANKYNVKNHPTRFDLIKDNNVYVEKKNTCITWDNLWQYAGDKDIYAWFIDDLEIFENPKDLGGFNLKRPPQSWCYIKGYKNERLNFRTIY